MTASSRPPYARITKIGRWRYNIVIIDGIGKYGPGMMGTVLGWHAWGRERAERKARKVLAEYLLDRQPESWEVTT